MGVQGQANEKDNELLGRPIDDMKRRGRNAIKDIFGIFGIEICMHKDTVFTKRVAISYSKSVEG